LPLDRYKHYIFGRWNNNTIFFDSESYDYLLRIGYAGMNQLMANIDSEGFGSGDFECDPAILKFDSYTADYGIGFADYVRNAGLSLSRSRKTRRKLICVLISRHWAIYQLTSGRCFRTGRNCRPIHSSRRQRNSDSADRRRKSVKDNRGALFIR
jgi:hypothetical protein